MEGRGPRRERRTHTGTHTESHTVIHTYTQSRTCSHIQPHTITHTYAHSHTITHTKDRQERSWKPQAEPLARRPLLLRPPVTPDDPQKPPELQPGELRSRHYRAAPSACGVPGPENAGRWSPPEPALGGQGPRLRHRSPAGPVRLLLLRRPRPHPFLSCPAPLAALTPFQVLSLNHTSGLSLSGFVTGKPGQRYSPLSFNSF